MYIPVQDVDLWISQMQYLRNRLANDYNFDILEEYIVNGHLKNLSTKYFAYILYTLDGADVTKKLRNCIACYTKY